MGGLLPIHGFVLAGGKSSRMGTDKALLEFEGEPMVARAVRTLGTVCERVSVAGNRDDLAAFAPVVHEARDDEGPAAGIEACLTVLQSEWAMFSPVDTPLLPAKFVRHWAEAVLGRAGTRASYMRCGDDVHPALCLIHRSCAEQVVAEVESGQRRVRWLLEALDGLWVAEATEFAAAEEAEVWLRNLNTPEDVAAASNR